MAIRISTAGSHYVLWQLGHEHQALTRGLELCGGVLLSMPWCPSGQLQLCTWRLIGLSCCSGHGGVPVAAIA